jgi:hypothetical protein
MLGILVNGPTWEICPKNKKIKFRTISSGYLKISRIKESPQFGWVKKLQRTAGFQIVRGEYQPWYPSWSTTGLVTFSNTQSPPLQIYSSRHKTDWPAIPEQTNEQMDRTSIWVSGPWQRDGQTGPDLGFRTSTDGRTNKTSTNEQTNARTDKSINIVDIGWRPWCLRKGKLDGSRPYQSCFACDKKGFLKFFQCNT